MKRSNQLGWMAIVVATTLCPGCADSPGPTSDTPAAPPKPASPPAVATRPAATMQATTTQAATQPAPATRSAVAATRPTTRPRKTAAVRPPRVLEPVVVSEDGLSVKGEFTASTLLDVGWLRVVELFDADRPADISARQRPPRTFDLETTNVKRILVDFSKTELSREKSLILRLDKGSGISTFPKDTPLYLLERTLTGRWVIVDKLHPPKP